MMDGETEIKCISCGEISNVLVDGICSDCQTALDNDESDEYDRKECFTNGLKA